MAADFSFFGSTIRETFGALEKPKKVQIPVDAKPQNTEIPVAQPPKRIGSKPKKSTNKEAEALPSSPPEKEDKFENRSKAIMRIVVTLILLGISVFLLIDKSTESKTLPCSIISAITGYWLK